MRKIILIFLTILSVGSFGQVSKIKIQKEKTETLPDIDCPFVFVVDSSLLNKKLKVATVMFKGKGFTKDNQKKFDENRPFLSGKEYLITYKSIQNELKDWCNVENIKILKVEIEKTNDTLFSIIATFGPK